MALALARFGEAVDEIAEGTGVREAWFICKDDNVANLCKAHGFEELLNFRVLRRKIERRTTAAESSGEQIPHEPQ